jgi:hypothetical protein
MSKFYCGVGSRETPPLIIVMIRAISEYQFTHEYILRSGHARGADQAFEWGAGTKCEIYLPWGTFEADVEIEGTPYFEPTEAALEMAKKFHPAWDRLGQGGQKLHARNCHQVLGHDLQTPCKEVICWTKDGLTQGGTAQAIRIADRYEIPVYNLGKGSVFRSWQKKLKS